MISQYHKQNENDRKKASLKKSIAALLTAVLVCVSLTFSGCGADENENSASSDTGQKTEQQTKVNYKKGGSSENDAEDHISLSKVPAYSGDPYVEINGGRPDFESRQLTTKEFEKYSELDGRGRCRTAYVNVSEKTMPTEKRGSIGMIKPTGWHTIRYDFVDGKYLYNRCHLVAHELAGEDANEENLITGTRYMNIEGMLPFENEVADYVKDTGNHVLYKVTPVFKGKNLLASGVHMEAESVEDKGRGISFNIYCYNVQPGVHIDYSNGNSYEKKTGEPGELGGSSNRSTAGSGSSSRSSESLSKKAGSRQTFILNTNTGKFHRKDCRMARTIAPKNRSTIKTTAKAMEKRGYSPCKVCNPD